MTPEDIVEHKDRRLILVAIGLLLLLVGVAAALFGPAEMYCFYLFSEGGRFHYDGFGFGSFMFGNIACQIVGYYVIAVLLIPLGYGHLRRRRWARTLSLTLLWSWLVLGVPLTIVFLFMLFSVKELSVVAGLAILVVVGLSYPALPALLIWFYRSRDVRLTFETGDPKSYWTEKLPLPVLVLCFLQAFYAVALHIPILFRGVFPLFGVLLSDLAGILVSDVLIMGLILLIWGTLRQRVWAWWGSLAFFCALAVSTIWTLSGASLSDILALMNFPPTETKALQNLPFQGYHFAAFLGLPLLLSLAVVAFSRRDFEAGSTLVS
jgi:hypothetical protein